MAGGRPPKFKSPEQKSMKPYNSNVILEKQTEESISDSGIIIDRAAKEVYILVSGHAELEGKQVYLNLPATLIEGNIYATDVYNIIAYK